MGSTAAFWSAFVLLVFLRALSRWPLMVASERGGCLRNVLTDKPGNGGRNPCCNALSKVELAGDQRLRWANATRSSGFAFMLMALLA